jgi:plasmid stabilization system protein ParE
MTVHYRGQALFDLEEIFQYIEERSPSGARNVIDAIHDAIAQIAEHPLSAQRTSHAGTRVKVVRRYPYKIFYQVGVDQVEICIATWRAPPVVPGKVDDVGRRAEERLIPTALLGGLPTTS